MEVPKSLHFLLLLPLLLVFGIDEARQASFDDAVNAGHEKLLLDLQKLPWKEYQMEKAASGCIFQKPRVKKGTTTLEMKQKEYCTGKTPNWKTHFQTLLIFDAHHVKTLQSRFKSAINSGETSQLPISSGIHLQTLNYIVTAGIGRRNLTLIVDTGSDLTWIQCRPCKLCYNQQQPLFDPSVSPSFRPLPCNSTACAAACGPNPSPCNYQISYGDGSYSRGDLGFETLNLGEISVRDFVFGCGRNNQGLFGGVSGLMGLARSEISLVSQTASVFGGVFSYCLPTTGIGSSGSLTMGGNDFSIFKNVSPISYTKMVEIPEMSSFYFLNLTGISVGGVKLNISNNGVLNLIDSGTVITRFVPSIYRALKGEFEKQFSGFESVSGFSILNTCFNLSGVKSVNIPTVRFYFDGGAEMSVDVEGIFYFVKSDVSQTCLAFASLGYEDEIGIIGNYQQKNQRVVYDTKDSKVGFAGEPCSF